MATAIEVGQDAYRRRAWRNAYVDLLRADGELPLGREDLERLATAAHLIGSEDSEALWARTHQESLRLGATDAAVRCAFWLAMALFSKGEAARGGGWLARIQKLIADADLDGPERGYLLVTEALGCIEAGDAAAGLTLFTEVSDRGDRFADDDLATIGRVGRGQALIALGDCARGLALLDEVIIAVTGGEISPLATGLVYCAAAEACHDAFDMGRAEEWTAALSRWCDAQPDLVAYRGQCLVHRAEIMQLHGAWDDAADEARRAGERLSGEAAAGDALYRKAEVHRLRGELQLAEDAFRAANHCGRQPHPGLALLRLAQGQVDAAEAAIRRVLEETTEVVVRARVLGPFVDVTLAAGDVAAARAASDELTAIAVAVDAQYLRAVAAHASGAVLLAEGEARAALPVMRAAWAAWRDLDAPYEAARVRVLIGLACQALGDTDTAQMELDAARLGFQALGAAGDVAHVDSLMQTGHAERPRGLTVREVEVLALVAKGSTNREIASMLVISEHTVARHVQNIFGRIGVASRGAAIAFAYEHGLL